MPQPSSPRGRSSAGGRAAAGLQRAQAPSCNPAAPANSSVPEGVVTNTFLARSFCIYFQCFNKLPHVKRAQLLPGGQHNTFGQLRLLPAAAEGINQGSVNGKAQQ